MGCRQDPSTPPPPTPPSNVAGLGLALPTAGAAPPALGRSASSGAYLCPLDLHRVGLRSAPGQSPCCALLLPAAADPVGLILRKPGQGLMLNETLAGSRRHSAASEKALVLAGAPAPEMLQRTPNPLVQGVLKVPSTWLVGASVGSGPRTPTSGCAAVPVPQGEG